jgi:hypothetical protein
MMILNLSESTAARRRIPFACVDATDLTTDEPSLTFSAGDLKISKNGATEANHGGSVGEIANGLYYYQFTAAELDTVGFISLRTNKSGVKVDKFIAQVIDNDLNGNLDANIVAINSGTAAAVAQRDILDTCHDGVVETANVAATTTVFQATGLDEQTADHYNGRSLVFSSGVMGGSAVRITDYSWDAVNSESILTVSACQETPVDGTTFRII